MNDGNEIRHPIGADGTLIVRAVSGSVRIQGTDDDEAVVIARSADGGGIDRLNVERGAGRLLVEPPRSGLSVLRRPDVEIDFDVQMPRSARLELNSISADVRATDVAGEQSYKTVSADLDIDRASGRLSVQSVSGDVRLTDGGRLELNATTTSGDVTIEARALTEVRVRTVSGDVRLSALLEPGRRHAVETVSGDLFLQSDGGLTVEPARALDIGRTSRAPVVVGDGSAQLTFRSMSGEEHVSGGKQQRRPPLAAPAAAPEPGTPATTRLDVLRALERGEIDIDEAARRLEEVGADA